MSNLPLSRTDTVTRAALLCIKAMAQEQNVPERLVKAMNFRVDSHYDMNSMRVMLRIAWCDPDDGSSVRGFQQAYDDEMLRRGHDLYEVLKMSIEQLNLRGELFYFKLHKHFPNRIEKVDCTRDGTVTVRFKNGRTLSTNEVDLDSTEFLATCGMIYDL